MKKEEEQKEEKQKCEKCGEETIIKIVEGESYNYCPACDWITW